MATVTVPSSHPLFPQSPYLNLLAAGSNGADGSAPGIHLRWHLLGALGDHHLPKGDLASNAQLYPEYYTTAGYNRPDDYVYIHRAEYTQSYPAEVLFAEQLTSGSQLKDSGKTKQWVFDNLVPVPSLPNETCRMVVTFANATKYVQVKSIQNPLADPIAFLKKYDDVLEVKIGNNGIFFAIELIVGNDEIITTDGIQAYDLLMNGDSFITLPSHGFMYGSDFTIETILILESGQDAGVIMSQSSDSVQGGCVLTASRTGITAILNDSNTIYSVLLDTPLQEDTYHHVCITRDGTVLRFYLDGIQQGNDVEILGVTVGVSTAIILGKDVSGLSTSDNFVGILKDFRVWNVARTPDQIAANRYGNLSDNDIHLLAWYKLNEGTGQVVNDFSSYLLSGHLGNTSGVDSNDPEWLPSANPSLGVTKVEAIVKEENTPDSKYMIDVRKTFVNRLDNVLLHEDASYLLLEDRTFILLEEGGAPKIVNRLVSENIQYVRFRTYNSYPVGIRIETYHHFLKGVNAQGSEGGWTSLGSFSLSTDDAIVYERLEKPGVYDIHNRWPKYNDAAKVNTANYINKWINPVVDDPRPSLKQGIVSYLENSLQDDNLKAEAVVSSGGGVGNNKIGTWVVGQQPQEAELVVLDLLQMVTTDYHVARMMGLGHIDNVDLDEDDTKKYIHIATYQTTAPYPSTAPLDNFTENYTHSYMTLGTSKTDYRLPKKPEINLSYGFISRDIDGEEQSITDEEGYFYEVPMRAININLTNHVQVANSSDPIPAFFVPDKDYQNADSIDAIMYGIEYKRTSDVAWRSNELNSDPDFLDTNGVPEPIPILWPSEDKPLYTHLEKEAGSHDYASYSINWFSRASGKGTDQTILTTFPDYFSLLPPLNFTGQIIQYEDPDALFLTTSKEQQRLLGIPGPDKTLVRVMFNWNDIQNSNYWICNKVKFVFRQPMMKSTRGQIKSVMLSSITVQGKVEQVVEVHTQSYKRVSVSPAETVWPSVIFTNNEHLAYIGGVFNAGGEPFCVRDVLEPMVSDEGPIFLLEPVKKRSIAPRDDFNDYKNLGVITKNELPDVNALFTVFENLSDPSRWASPAAINLSRDLDIVKWSNYTETTIEKATGDPKVVTIGGITEFVTITEVADPDDASIPTGIYKFEFDSNPFDNQNVNLHYGSTTVEWYGGVIRMSLSNPVNNSLVGEIRRLDVIGIDTITSAGKLILHAIDNDVANQGGNGNVTLIPTGTNVLVNFHPGYRVYLYAETGFDQSTLFDFGTAKSHDSYLAAYSLDTTKSPALTSYVCPPVRLVAQKQYTAEKPPKPIGAAYATKPNYYGKSTYTFETQFASTNGRTPYSVQFYRGNEMAILQTLYEKDTVEDILTDLASLPNDTFYYDRWASLANAKTDNGNFETFGTGDNSYRFPNPDNEDYVVPYTDPSIQVRPFDKNNYTSQIVPAPGSNDYVVENPTDSDHYYRAASDWKMSAVVKEAILNTFLPLTEVPAVFDSIKDAHLPHTNANQPRNVKPTIRNRNGNMLSTSDPNYDPAPMAVLIDTTTNKVRFSDFTLDGASNRLFFYFAREITNTFLMGEVSEVLGPIKLVNTSPATPPQIQTVTTQAEDVLNGLQPAVLFDILDYLPSDKITRFKIYRAFDATSATSVRTMKLASTISASDPLVDYFDDLAFVPFGDPLFYRIVAVREVQMTDDLPPVFEDIESLPSNIALTNLIDVNNPLAPEITYTTGAGSNDALFKNVVLTWESVAYNATYYLYQMTATGNWTKIYSTKTNEAQITFQLPENLVKLDEDSNELYYRFKVSVENSSGLLNIEENEITI